MIGTKTSRHPSAQYQQVAIILIIRECDIGRFRAQGVWMSEMEDRRDHGQYSPPA